MKRIKTNNECSEKVRCSRKLSFSLLFFIFFFPLIAPAQPRLPHYHDSLFSNYYLQRVALFSALPETKNDIIFLGNSITDGGEWSELFHDPHIINRGISGDITLGVLNRLGQIVKRNPEKVFLLIGINDLAKGWPPDSVYNNIIRIVALIHACSPATTVYVQSIFPVNQKFSKFPLHTNKEKQIKYINEKLRQKAEADDFIYINVYDALKDSSGALDPKYTNDGLHLLGAGYMIWKHVLYPYVYGLQQKPSLVPQPQSLAWEEDLFPLYQCNTIAVNKDSLTKVAKGLQDILKAKGIQTVINSNITANSPSIELRIGGVETPLNKEEAYTLSVDNKRIVITGNTTHGIFNGIQTLRQLMRDGVYVNGCHIKDWPAFSWRGYMVDVGRNYQSVKQLKEQIDVMAHYKLNIFHFHLTENIAWRLQIKRYPQLTAVNTMTRNKGQYYTIAKMKDLIQYCKDRYITLVPEIDMPGHSDAFKRAMGTDMQSDTGLMIVKNILREVDSTYKNIPYFHIGADEVIIKNKNFIPEVTHLLQDAGKRTVGWKPGGNYGENTIRQLWNWQNPKPDKQGLRYIDSRDLYLDGMDPFSGVIQIFNKKICDAEEGNKYLLGGEICAWNDTRIKDEKDFLLTNPIYPAIVAFGERSWRGGGYNTDLTTFKTNDSKRFKEFKEFERRLLDQKTAFFTGRPFPYVRQTQIQWKLFGPFDNNGNTSAVFWPEKKWNSLEDSAAHLKVNGGTVKLHRLQGVKVTDTTGKPLSNATWYAYRKIYSSADTTGYFWISFYNVARSQHIATPPLGQWDRKGGKIWVNGEIVPPPQWTYPGRSGNQETPLVDEGYSYRPPTEIHLKKGWNFVLVKAPIAKYYRWDWLDPVKWMFTVVRVQQDENIH